MALQHLRSFVEVYRQRSLSAAARNLDLTQPAVSQHIGALEAAIGHPLFDRHAKGVVPTPAADELAAGLGDRLEAAEAAFAQARARSSDMTGIVRIMSHSDFLAERLMPRLVPLLEQGMRLRLIDGGREAIREALLEGDCDIAVSAYPVNDQRLRSEKVHAESLHAVAAPQVVERLGREPDLAAALAAEPVLAFDFEQQLIDDWLAANALAVRPVQAAMVCQDLRGLRAILMQGYGWSVLPAYVCQTALASGELAELPAPVTTPINRYFLVCAPSALREPRVAVARAALRAILTGREGTRAA